MSVSTTRSTSFGTASASEAVTRVSLGRRRQLDAEVGAREGGRAEQLLAGAGLHDRAGLEDVRAVCDLERLRRVLLDEEDRDALRVDLADDLEVRLDEDRREPERGLVEHQELWLRHERAADREHLLLAARQGSRELRDALLQAGEELEDAVHVLLDPGRILPEERPHPQVVD